MGEYADMAIDSMLAMDYHQMNGDYDDDPIWSPFSRRPRAPQPKTCKRCGQKGLWWGKSKDGRWQLEEELMLVVAGCEILERLPHQCQLGIKQAFAQMKLDKDPGIAYNAYLDTIPGWTEDDYCENRR